MTDTVFRLVAALVLVGFWATAVLAGKAPGKASEPSWETAGTVTYDPDNGKVLLVLQTREQREHGTNGWTLPKGRVDRGESLERAARREGREESGVDAVVGPLVTVYRSRRARRTYFLAKKLGTVGKPDHETTRRAWFSYEDAMALLQRKRDRTILGAARPILEKIGKKSKRERRKEVAKKAHRRKKKPRAKGAHKRTKKQPHRRAKRR
jgi:ADP-ribose pyrophosphatase YjhB (NUDIX family)